MTTQLTTFASADPKAPDTAKRAVDLMTPI